jgi:hypothetical protein
MLEYGRLAARFGLKSYVQFRSNFDVIVQLLFVKPPCLASCHIAFSFHFAWIPGINNSGEGKKR